LTAIFVGFVGDLTTNGVGRIENVFETLRLNSTGEIKAIGNDVRNVVATCYWVAGIVSARVVVVARR